MSAITSKARMYELLRAGRLGHTLPSAEDAAEALALTARPGTFAVRTKASGGACHYGLEAAEALALTRSLPAGSWNLAPMLSDPDRVCYAHLLDAVGGWHLHYSEDKKPCRLDGRSCVEKRLNGLAAKLYVRRAADELGWQLINDLLEAYPDHVVEFSVMASSLAAWGPTNVIVWEVRCATGEYEAFDWRAK